MKQQTFCIRIYRGTPEAVGDTCLPPCFCVHSPRILVLGEPYCIQNGEKVAADGDMLLRLYRKRGTQLGQVVYGPYCLILPERNGRRITVIRSPLGHGQEVYCSLDPDGILLSNRLAKHINARSIPPRLAQKNQVDFFLQHGFLPGEQTLIRGVLRVAPGTVMQLDSHRMEAQSMGFSWEMPVSYTAAEAEQVYPQLLSQLLAQQSKAKQPLAVTLSGGYDSNFLLHLLRQETDRPIQAFSIGGKTGRNETLCAAQIARGYKDVQLHTALVDSATLQCLPDIVWRLEGTVYERGIFLQYALAKLLEQHKITHIIEGDGADQVMRENYCPVQQVDFSSLKHLWHEYPDFALKYLVLPKNMKLLASQGIRPQYPYLDIRLIACFDALKQANGPRKALHVKIVEAAVGEHVKQHLTDLGGSTQVGALWDVQMQEQALEMQVRRLYLEVFRVLFLGDFCRQHENQCSCRLTLDQCLGKPQ